MLFCQNISTSLSSSLHNVTYVLYYSKYSQNNTVREHRVHLDYSWCLPYVWVSTDYFPLAIITGIITGKPDNSDEPFLKPYGIG